ncbi:MAG: LuxR C-terminal-related transcriptional regulator [Bryobacterales bacterium]|nr:LuxR C-terminal-related transcriptional regulator [Bryobacterales bacterium]
MAGWQDTLADREIPVAWLSLDDHDQDVFQFMSYLMEACKVSGLVSNAHLPTPTSGESHANPRALVLAALTELSKSGGHQIVILDDFHRASSPENCRAMEELLARAPENFHIVISSREYPRSIPLADLQARGELFEIDHASLRFSESEIRDWLSSEVESSAPEDWSTQLFDRTEGWPIALKTVRRWVTEGASLSDTLAEISGRSSDLSDYFFEQVFEDLDGATQTFLLKTSILKRMNGDLANWLCGTSDGWQTLDLLERRDIFVESLDRERTWYRYHRLFAEFLQERLRRRPDGMLDSLHRAACQWFREQGLTAEAVQHALASNQADVVADLYESLGGWHYALKGHVGGLQQALSLVDDTELENHPRLWLGKIYLTVRRGEIERARSEFERLVAKSESSRRPDGEFKGELLIMRSLLNRYADQDITEGEIAQLEQLDTLLSRDNDLMHAVRWNLLCVMYSQRGDFDACVSAGDKAIRRFRGMGSVFGETFIYFHEGYACMAQGRLRDADALYGAGQAIALEHFGTDSDLAAIAAVFLAELAYEKNNVKEAARLLRGALPHIERSDAWLDVYAAAYATAMKLTQCLPGEPSAREIRHRAESVAASRGLPRLRVLAELQEMELQYMQGMDAVCTDKERIASYRANGHLAMRQLRVSVKARAHLQAGENREAIQLLRTECRRCLDHRLIRSFVTLSVLQAGACWADGQTEAANDALEAALSLALFEGIKRPFINEGDALLGVIRNRKNRSQEQHSNRLRDRFLAELLIEMETPQGARSERPDDFTPRETEVIRQLLQGHSNREIAEVAAISVNTVKFHVKNIFEKLDINSRKDAAAALARRRFSL